MQTEDPDEFESRPAHRRVGTYLIGIFVMGLAASVLVFSIAMEGVGWPPAILGGPKATAANSFAESAKVLLYTSSNSKAYFTSIGGNYDILLKPWRDYLSTQRQQGREVTDPNEIQALSSGILVVPSAAALGPAERQAILAFRDRGGSVLVTWATGTRGAAGDWTGWDFLDKLGGVKFAGEIPKEAEVGHLVLNGESPVSINQAAGKRIWIGSNAERALRLKGAAVGAQFLNWSRTPDHERMDEGAVLYSESGAGGGRVVVFAFAESSWEQQPTDIHALVTDALSWLRHKPTLIKAAWPYGKQAAQLIEMDTEEGFPNALLLAAMLKDKSIPGAFYALTSSAVQFPDVLKSLYKNFEIGYHGDVHVSFKDQAKDVQEQRIVRMKAEMQGALQGASGSPLVGFRAPTEGYDKTTEILLLKYGFRHHISGPHDSNIRLPFFAPIAGTDVNDGLILLPRSQRDDLNLLASITDPALLTQAMVDDFRQGRDNGALCVFSLHSQNFGDGQPLNAALPAYLSYVQSQKNTVWLASPQAIDTWWRDRERLQIIVRPVGPRIEFDVTVGGKQPVKGGSLTIVLPKKGLLPVISGLKINMPTPKVTLVDDFRASIVFESLSPGNYFFQAVF